MKTRILAMLGALVVLAFAAVASAEDADVTITGGSLTFTGAAVSLNGVTLDGTDQTSTPTTAGDADWTAVDARGTGAGWNITIDATDFEINETQTIYNGATGGTFTISFSGQGPTNAIAYDAAAGTVETELEALSNITNVTVTGAGTSGDPWTITFMNPGGQDAAEITADDTNLTGGTPTSTIATTQAGAEALKVMNITGTDGEFLIRIDDADTVTNAGNTAPVSQVDGAYSAVPETPAAGLKVMSAAVDTGMGNYTLKPTYEIEVPAESYAGSFVSVMTITETSGP